MKLRYHWIKWLGFNETKCKQKDRQKNECRREQWEAIKSLCFRQINNIKYLKWISSEKHMKFLSFSFVRPSNFTDTIISVCGRNNFSQNYHCHYKIAHSISFGLIVCDERTFADCCNKNGVLSLSREESEARTAFNLKTTKIDKIKMGKFNEETIIKRSWYFQFSLSVKNSEPIGCCVPFVTVMGDR